MNTVDALIDFLSGIDGKGYKAYKGLRGTWVLRDFALHVDHAGHRLQLAAVLERVQKP